MQTEIVLENRNTHSNTDPDGGAVFYIRRGIPYIRTDGGITTTPLATAVFSNAGQVLDGDTVIDFTEMSNGIRGLSFDDMDDHSFSLPVGSYNIELFVEVDNTGASDQGDFRKVELTVDSETISYDIRPPISTIQNVSLVALVITDEPANVAVNFTHNADDDLAIGDICYVNFIKVA